MAPNIDQKTVEGFGFEWRTFDQSTLSEEELNRLWAGYFRIFPWRVLPSDAIGFDAGCGSGRWAKVVASKVGTLHCIDASIEALEVARGNLVGMPNCVFHHATVDQIPFPDETADFGYSLGVLHHLPNTEMGIRSCVQKIKKGGPFLLYLYYAFDNRAPWYRTLWKISDILRRGICRLPYLLRYLFTQIIAILVYWPLARFARLIELAGLNVDSFPLSAYRNLTFYLMRTDAFDRFATRVEHRFTAQEIQEMMMRAGLERIEFSDTRPYWSAVGYRRD
jgi:SAM-dependent methyltransferase